MLKVVGAASLDALIDETVPGSIRQKAPLAFGDPMSEREVLDHLKATARKNTVMLSLIGQGYHGTIMPPVIQRCILENPAWYTAYTPYQPEISQGRLERQRKPWPWQSGPLNPNKPRFSSIITVTRRPSR